MNDNIYNNPIFKYPLSSDEIIHLDEVWKFIKVFNKPFLYLNEYRNYLIKKINKKYSLEEFYLYETIANKLLWNLRWILVEHFSTKSMEEVSKCRQMKYSNSSDLDEKIRKIENYLGNYYRSFINKLIIVNQKDHTIYYKKMEGSSNIFNHNKFNLLTMYIFMNRKLYERMIQDTKECKEIVDNLPEYYYQYDYGFPNINLCCYKIGIDDDRKYKIKKMYYEKNPENWVKIII